jgi:hypothetical protein
MIRAFANGVWFFAIPAKLREGALWDEKSERDETEECAGCVFEKSEIGACRAAERAALAAGLPDCESRPDLNKPGFIYQRDPSNGRQMDLLENMTNTLETV